jgi:hypothetical protein
MRISELKIVQINVNTNYKNKIIVHKIYRNLKEREYPS